MGCLSCIKLLIISEPNVPVATYLAEKLERVKSKFVLEYFITNLLAKNRVKLDKPGEFTSYTRLLRIRLNALMNNSYFEIFISKTFQVGKFKKKKIHP